MQNLANFSSSINGFFFLIFHIFSIFLDFLFLNAFFFSKKKNLCNGAKSCIFLVI